MSNCKDKIKIALAESVMVKIPTNPLPARAKVLDYDEEMNEFEVKIFGAWRLHQNWWVPCEDIMV